MDAMAYMFSVAREDSSNVLEFKPECIMEEDLMSLSSKFPLIPGSQRSITFCTTTLSQKLRETPLDADFDLTDPCSPPPRYNVLHDPHLKEYFQNAAMRKRLIEKGFITPSGFVKCTLLEFNMFRQWIRKLKLDRIHQERRQQRQIEKQQWKERQAREQLLRDEELYSIVREREQKARELKECAKKRREADRRKYLKLQEVDRKRREKFEEDRKRKKDMNENQREKNLARKQVQKVEEEEKVKKIKIRLLVKRSSEDKQRENMLQKRRQTLVEEKEKKLKENWKRRCSLSLARQEEKRKREEAEREEHNRNVARRTSIVAQQRRKSRVYHDMCLQRRRDTLEKQHLEAENFLERMREKKIRDLETWKQKHERMRERHLQQGRRVSLQNKSSGLGPENRRGSRLSSVWDLQSSLKREFGIDDNVVYSGVVFAGRKATHGARQSVQLEALAEEATSKQVEEVDRYEKLLSRLEAEFALREQVHYVVFGLISNAQDVLDLLERLEIARGVPNYVQGIVDAAQRILAGDQTGEGDVKTQLRNYILRLINNAASSVDDSDMLLSSEEQRRAAQEIVNDAVSRAKEEVQQRASLSGTAKEIVTAAISSASQKALGAEKDTMAAPETISENLSKCAKDIVTAAIVSALHHGKDDREVVAARSLAADAVQAAKASLERFYGLKFELIDKEQADTQDISTSLDKCAKDVAAAAIISATRSLERAITKDDREATVARSLAADAVAAAKASLEKLYGVKAEIEDGEREPSTDISKCLVKSARDIAQAVVASPIRKGNLEDRAAQSLASDAVQAAVGSLENLYGIKVDPEDESEQTAKEIAAAAVISATGSLGRDLKRSDVDLEVAAREMASSAVESAKASLDWLYSTKVAPRAIEGDQKRFFSLEEAAKNVAEVAVDLATRSLERISEKNEWELTSTTRELVNGVLDSAKASLEKLYGIKIETETELIPSSQETSIISSASDSLESVLSVKDHEEELKKAAQRLASNAIKSANASLERLHCIVDGMEAKIKKTALGISKSLVDSSGNLLQQLEKEGLGIAARDLACTAIEAAAKSLSKLCKDETSVQDIVGSDSRLLHSAAKVSTISARASLGELFDRGFIGGVELEEATGYLATHAVISAENMLEKVQDDSATVDLNLEICKAASELASHAVLSAEGSVARLMQSDQPNPSERGSDHGTLFWKVTTYVEGLINGALRSLGTTEYADNISDDREQFEVITHNEASTADAEYGPHVQDLYQREIRALKASRIVNDVVDNAMDIVKTRRKNSSFFSVAEVRPGNARFTRRRSSSVHFNEGSIFHPRRDSYVPRETDFLSTAKRPPTPRFRKGRAGSVVSQEIQELEKELAIPSDGDLTTLNVSDSDLVQRSSSDPGPEFHCGDVPPSKPERSASDSKINVEDQGSSLSEKLSLYDIIKKREGIASCEISPCGSYVVLPHLNPSECSLIAARVESYDVLWNQKKTSSSVTSLPYLSPKGSFINSEAVEQVPQRKESRSRSVPSSSRLPDITSSSTKLSKASLSASSLKQSAEQPRRTSSLQLKKPSPRTSKESAKLSPSKTSTGKDLQSPLSSVGEVTAPSRTSLRSQESSRHRSSEKAIAASPKASVKNVRHLQDASAAKNIISPGSSLTRKSLSPRASSERATLSKPTSQNRLASSPQTSILFARASTEKTILSGSSLEKTAASRGSVNKMAPTSHVATEKVNLSPRVSKGKVTSSPRVSREKVVLSPKTSIGKVTHSPRASTENAALSPRVSKGKITQSSRASTENATLSGNVSEGKITQSPRASTENAALSPRVSKNKVTKSPRASTENAALSTRVSKGKVTHSPRVSTEKVTLSPGVSKGKVTHSSRVSAEKTAVSSHSSKENVSVSTRASAENTTATSGSAEKVPTEVRMSKDKKTSVGKTESSDNAVDILQKTSKTVETSLIPSVDSKDVTEKRELSETTDESPKESKNSRENLAKDSTSSAAKLENSVDLNVGEKQGNEVVEDSLTSVQCVPPRSDARQMQGVGSELDHLDVNKDKADGEYSEMKQVEANKNLKNVVPSLERIIQDKRLTPEGAEAETRPASSVDVLTSIKYAYPDRPQRIVPVKQDINENMKASDNLKISLSRSRSSTASSKVGGTTIRQGSSRSSQEMMASKASDENELITPRKKPEGEDRSEVQGVPLRVGSFSPKNRRERTKSFTKMPDASTPRVEQVPEIKQQPVTSSRVVNDEVESYPTYRKVSISRSIHDTVDEMVQKMLNTADEPSAVEASCLSGRGSREEMKRDSETNVNEPRRFGRERRFPTGKVSKTVIETVDFMLQSVSSSDDKGPRQSPGRKFSGSDIQGGHDLPRSASSMERFSRRTPSAQGISCVYGMSPSPPKLPSPKRSRFRTASQDSLAIRATQSDSSILSSSSDKAVDLKPKVSAAWLDDVIVGGGDASVRSQSPKRPYSSPTPSLHKRSSGRLSVRHSLDGVSMETDSTVVKAT